MHFLMYGGDQVLEARDRDRSMALFSGGVAPALPLGELRDYGLDLIRTWLVADLLPRTRRRNAR